MLCVLIYGGLSGKVLLANIRLLLLLILLFVCNLNINKIDKTFWINVQILKTEMFCPGCNIVYGRVNFLQKNVFDK